MKMLYFVSLILSMHALLVGGVSAQPQTPVIEWERTYDREHNTGINSGLQCSDGGYILGGSADIYSSYFSDSWLLKTDANGDCLWSRGYGGQSMDHCMSLVQAEDGGYVLAGNTLSFGAGGWDFWLLKTDADGDSQWSRTYGGSHSDGCADVLQTLDGGCILVGSTTSYGAGSIDLWLVKTNANGDSQWSHTYGGDGDDWGVSVVQTADGGYTIAGTTYSYGAGWNDFWLIKTDAEGDCLWTRTYGRPFPDNCLDMAQTMDGGYILAGGGTPIDLYSGKNQLVKINSSGEQEWIRNYSTPQGEGLAASVLQTSDGGYLLGGFFDDAGIDFRAWIVRTDGDGDSLWSLIFTGPEGCDLRDIVKTTDGGFVLAGYKRLDLSYDVAWLAKLAPEMSTSYVPHPHSIHLLSAYPNPFNSTTQIEFTLPATQRVSLRLYDVLGREVAVLLNEMRTAGKYSVRFDGGGLSSGIYFCRMEAGRETRTQKIVLMK